MTAVVINVRGLYARMAALQRFVDAYAPTLLFLRFTIEE